MTSGADTAALGRGVGAGEGGERQAGRAPSQPGAVEGARWHATYATTVAYLGCLACLPVPFWLADIWLGGVLGGGAAGLLSIPLSMVLAGLASRKPAWDAPVPNRPGADAAVLGLAVAQGVALSLAGWHHRDWLMLSGWLIPPFVLVWVWGYLGWGRAKAVLFPVLFGWYALPWEWFLRKSFDLFLQAWTADIAVALLRLAGYPVRYWNDYTFYTWEFYLIVNETCSGMNMLVSLSMYTLIFAWLVQPSLKYRVWLMALVFPVAMLVNGLRVAVIYLLGHHGDQALAMGPWHTGSAYLIFLPVFWFIYVVNGVLLKRWQRARAAARSAG